MEKKFKGTEYETGPKRVGGWINLIKTHKPTIHQRFPNFVGSIGHILGGLESLTDMLNHAEILQQDSLQKFNLHKIDDDNVGSKKKKRRNKKKRQMDSTTTGDDGLNDGDDEFSSDDYITDEPSPELQSAVNLEKYIINAPFYHRFATNYKDQIQLTEAYVVYLF